MEKNPENCPKTYLMASIITAIFCCWPLSIPAIIYASKVEEYFYDGNYEAAVKASNTAKNWVIASVLTLIIPVFLMLLVLFFSAIMQGL
tara:strand:+ start:626 stop:892 length:267 start_codon:yes stop_codon:yes gene_type:complete